MSDEAEDREADEFMGRIFIAMRKEIVASLLAGNDTGCFTTEQYRRAYRKRWPPPPGLECIELKTEQAEMHLRTLGVLREVAPGIWTSKTIGGK